MYMIRCAQEHKSVPMLSPQQTLYQVIKDVIPSSQVEKACFSRWGKGSEETTQSQLACGKAKDEGLRVQHSCIVFA